MAELQRITKFPTLGVVEHHTAWIDPTNKAGDLRLPERMQSLGAVLERLWRFYEAMHSGKPLKNGEEVLPQMGNALKNAVRPGDSA